MKLNCLSEIIREAVKMFKLLALVALVSLASGATLSKDSLQDFLWSPTGRIVGGEDATIEDVPYQISLRYRNRLICGGTIISRYWIVTAAHCSGYDSSFYTVYAGSNDRTNGGTEHRVVSVIIHEGYGMTSKGIPFNDVALMRVSEPFELDATRQPIELFEAGVESLAGSEAVITGWGTTGDGSLPTTLKLARVPIVSKEYCGKAYRAFNGIPAGQICAAYPEGGTDACQGDSGGPLAIDGKLAGITSWGNGCAIPGQPGVYTEVAAFSEWIKLNSGV